MKLKRKTQKKPHKSTKQTCELVIRPENLIKRILKQIMKPNSQTT